MTPHIMRRFVIGVCSLSADLSYLRLFILVMKTQKPCWNTWSSKAIVTTTGITIRGFRVSCASHWTYSPRNKQAGASRSQLPCWHALLPRAQPT